MGHPVDACVRDPMVLHVVMRPMRTERHWRHDSGDALDLEGMDTHVLGIRTTVSLGLAVRALAFAGS